MRTSFPKPSVLLLAAAFALCGQSAHAQSSQSQPAPPAEATQPATTPHQTQAIPPPQGRSAGGDVGSGAGDIGKGAGEGVGKAAEGVGKGAGDLVTLHPIDAAGNIGKGAVIGTKDVGVGAVKGTGKIAKGTGRGIGHLFHHGHKDKDEPTPSPSAAYAPSAPPN